MTSVTPEDLAAVVASLRADQPLTHCLTNIVVAPFTANVLLAAGATPAMVDNPHEAAGFASVAGGVLVNLGTPYDDTSLAMERAAEAAAGSGTPWVLDPVAAGALPWRTQLADRLLGRHSPTVLRGNPSEILGLTGGAGGRGPDSVDSPEQALETAQDLAREHGCVVAVSGPVDHLTDGDRVMRIGNGHPWMTRVTGVGCALGALMAACSAVTEDRLAAAAAGTGLLTVAAEAAAAGSRGPGSFAVGLLDELSILAPERLAEQVKLW